jgi:hypothetical protein
LIFSDILSSPFVEESPPLPVSSLFPHVVPRELFVPPSAMNRIRLSRGLAIVHTAVRAAFEAADAGRSCMLIVRRATTCHVGELKEIFSRSSLVDILRRRFGDASCIARAFVGMVDVGRSCLLVVRFAATVFSGRNCLFAALRIDN